MVMFSRKLEGAEDLVERSSVIYCAKRTVMTRRLIWATEPRGEKTVNSIMNAYPLYARVFSFGLLAR
jgi:hypothetical protein